jgi:hypothetical protein
VPAGTNWHQTSFDQTDVRWRSAWRHEQMLAIVDHHANLQYALFLHLR